MNKPVKPIQFLERGSERLGCFSYENYPEGIRTVFIDACLKQKGVDIKDAFIKIYPDHLQLWRLYQAVENPNYESEMQQYREELEQYCDFLEGRVESLKETLANAY